MSIVKLNNLGKEVKWDCNGLSPWLRSTFIEGGFGSDQDLARMFFIGIKGYSKDEVEKGIIDVTGNIRSYINQLRKRKWTKKRGHSIEMADIGKSKRVYCLSKFVEKIEDTLNDQESLDFTSMKENSKISNVTREKGITWFADGQYNLIDEMPLIWCSNLINMLDRKYKGKDNHYLFSGYTVKETKIALEKRIKSIR
tara:strand:- start:600 stop:1190 length:591 start_codon:yes stop_codon:yes gene_type:complete